MTTPSALRPVSDNLGYVGAALAYLVAAIHLFHPDQGFPRLAVLVATGNTSLLSHDPRPAAFVLSGVAIVVGLQVLVLGRARRPIYALGAGLMATYFVGYFAWHLSGHGGFLPGRVPLYHGLGPVEAVVAHLRGEPLATLSKAAEATLFTILVVLYRRDTGSGG